MKKSSTDQLLAWASTPNDSDKGKGQVLPDFTKIQNQDWSGVLELTEVATDVRGKIENLKGGAAKKPEKKEPELTPKEIFHLKQLNETGFEIKTEPEYVNEQIEHFKDKLRVIENYDSVRGGIGEIKSILLRFENRKKYPEFHDFFDQYPYTTSSKIGGLLKKYDYLKNDLVAAFVAEMPKEATDVMKEYNKYTQKLCGRDAIFYIIANKKDFEKRQSRRDPILLVQSPFGHFWQILGAWDEEMLLVEEL